MKVEAAKLKHQIREIINGLESAISDGLTEVATKAAEVARQNHAYKNRTGELEANTVPYKNSALDQGIIANKYYASWVEFGNGPPGSRIYPVSAKCLHFFLDGKEIFASSVRASEPKPFMENAVKYINSMGTQIMSKHLDNFFKRL